MNERWAAVPIPEFEDYYMISENGRVFSKHRNRELKPKITRAGYLRITLCNNSVHRSVFVHRLVALAFVPNKDGKPTVNHINEIKTDNRAKNLEWATTLEQNTHGTRIERAKASTDWEKRKIDYHSVASKHNYSSQNMCNRKKTKAIKGGKVIGVFSTQREAAYYCGVSRSKVSQ